jgi:serine/threonine protein kinase
MGSAANLIFLWFVIKGTNSVMGTRQGLVLSWDQRVKIALSAALGIEFLHHKTEPCIIHGDIKSNNILLFDNDVAKIGDLRVSKNHPGYLDDLILDRVIPCLGLSLRMACTLILITLSLVLLGVNLPGRAMYFF